VATNRVERFRCVILLSPARTAKYFHITTAVTLIR
jgi:hypothetical protein